MNLSKNQKIAIAVVSVVLVGAMYMRFKKGKKTVATMPALSENMPDNFTVKLSTTADPTGATYLILGGKKFGFSSQEAFSNYGYTVPKIITKAELDLYPSGGFVDKTGKVIKA
jgi:hypothetical protein